MDKNTTPFTTPQQKTTDPMRHTYPRLSPKQKTLDFLRTFARTYRSSILLPEGMPGFALN